MVHDDWQSETLGRLEESGVFRRLRSACATVAYGASILDLVGKVVFEAYHQTKSVMRHMKDYTLHDGEHLFRVLNLIERITGDELLDELTAPELMLLILASFYHDIGMAPAEADVEMWRRFWDTDRGDAESSETFKSFERYCSSYPNRLEEIERARKLGKDTAAEVLKSHLISEFIRQTHADRARYTIDQNWRGKIKFRDVDLTVEFAELCFSHNQDALRLLELDYALLCGPDTTCNLPLVGLLVRLADLLDFDAKRTPDVLFSHLAVANPVSLVEWQKHRSIDAWSINPKQFTFQAKCEHPAIEAAIHDFCDIIDLELQACHSVLSALRNSEGSGMRLSKWTLPPSINRERIGTKRDVFGKPLYIYRKTRFELSKTQVIDLLMGTKLYGNPEVALRELLQNSIDACQLRAAMERSWGNQYTPGISVRYSISNGEHLLEVEDNGVGMDAVIIDNFYSRVGKSFYKSSEFFALKASSNADFAPTSRFGIGILSAFMVAESIQVETRRLIGPHESSDPLQVLIEGAESIFWLKAGSRSKPGTQTLLRLRAASNPWISLSEENFVKAVTKLVPNPPVPVTVSSGANSRLVNQDTFKVLRPTAIWQNQSSGGDHLRIVEFALDDVTRGIVGSFEVTLLQRRSRPTASVEFQPRKVKVEHEEYELKRSIVMENGEINQISSSITVEDDGSVDLERNSSKLAKSESLLSFHGVEVPSSLFVESWRRKAGQAHLVWPFPMRCIIDVCGSRDLELNSARTEIVSGDCWREFERELANLVLQQLKASLEDDYWTRLRDLLIQTTADGEFKCVLEELP